MDFIYCRHYTPVGVKVEEITGGEDKSARLAEMMARQIYCENGREGYRDIGHFDNGAPFLFGEDSRISIAHTKGLYIVATLPAAEGADLSRFSPSTALGVDAERRDRDQALKVREKFLNDEEQRMVPAGDVEAHVLAWTVKEAVLKASMRRDINYKDDIMIVEMPKPELATGSHKEIRDTALGKALLRLEDGILLSLVIFSYILDDRFIVTLAST